MATKIIKVQKGDQIMKIQAFLEADYVSAGWTVIER